MTDRNRVSYEKKMREAARAEKDDKGVLFTIDVDANEAASFGKNRHRMTLQGRVGSKGLDKITKFIRRCFKDGIFVFAIALALASTSCLSQSKSRCSNRTALHFYQLQKYGKF